MKIFIIILSTFLVFSSVEVNAQFLNLFSGTFSELMPTAKKSSKPIIIDFYTSWCSPCKKMEKEVLNSSQVYPYLNNNYISYKVDCESFDGVEIAQKYNIGAYPTFIILSPSGKELKRLVGFYDKNTFLRELKKYAQ